MNCLRASARRLGRIPFRWSRDRRGAIVLEWVAILPVFTVVVTVILQIAVIGTSSLVARYAAFSAGRAAMVGLPDHTKENAEDAAAMVLMAIAPGVSGSDELGWRFGETIRRQGEPWSFRKTEQRLAVARRAMELDISPDEILGGPETLRVKLRYPLRLAIPFAASVLGEYRVVDGVAGYYVDLSAEVELRSHGSRVAVSRSSLGRVTP